MLQKIRKKLYELILSYAETSTIAGIRDIFEPEQPWYGKAYWIVCVISLVSMAAVWSAQVI